MRKMIKVLIAGCFFASFAGSISSMAALNLETETSVAGVSVAFNNYYAGSLHPEDELAEALCANGKLDEAVKSSVPKEVPKVMAAPSPYENVAISKVSNYVNVRKEPNTTSEVVGKIYNNCAATILSTVSGEGGQWYQIKSGSVTGYIKSSYFITGSEAEAVAKQVGKPIARITNTATLRLRESPDRNSKTLDLLSKDAEYVVLGEEGEFAKISVDSDLVGYVFKDYIDIHVEFDQAVSVAEEKEQADEAARLKKEADEAISRLQAAKAEEAAKQTTAATTAAKKTTTAAPETTAAEAPGTSFSGTIVANPAGDSTQPATEEKKTEAPTTAKQTEAPTTKSVEVGPGGASGPGGNSSNSSKEVTSATRSAIVAYAKQFLGNPYVYGGTSLTNGADCSGFTQAIYAHFNISTGRSSRDQAAKGKEIAVSAVQPGDLLFYASGNYINHVAMYIGGGQVIHSSTPATGITITSSNYRTPCKAVTFID